jgi:transposase
MFWLAFSNWATHRLAPMIKVAKLIARHPQNVLTYLAHRITDTVAESPSSKIATVQKRTCGYRNPDQFKNSVYFHYGGLNLYPATVTHNDAG